MPLAINRRHTALDHAYTEISALGGRHNPANPVEAARAEIIEEAMAILERFGARDTRLPDAFYAGGRVPQPLSTRAA